MKVAVVGAGVHGSSTAYWLSKRGHQVNVFEQFPLGHDKGSSHGNSRIVRRAYPDPFYAEIMMEGYPLWNEIENDSGRKLLYECGLLYFGSSDSPAMQGVVQGLESLRIAHQVLNRASVASVMPELTLNDGEIAAFTPEAGWAHAALTIQTFQDLARSRGTVFSPERITDLAPLEGRFDRVVLCQGAWATQFLELAVRVTLQTFGYIEGRQEGPVWIEDGPLGIYGFPSEPWIPGIKAGVHYKDVPFEPDDLDRTPAEGAIELLKEFAKRRFGHREPKVDHAKGCLYTNTANEDFLIGNLSDTTLFVSACSGHGFKFGPWIGRTMADMVEGKKQPSDFQRFYCPTPVPQ